MFPSRVIGIFGQNGSGKSALMESVAMALYGVDAARTKKDAIRTHGTLTDCEVRVAFEHAGHEYEVRRALKGRGSAPDAELYGGGLLLASGASDVDQEVTRLLHMDLRVFHASVYAEQKQLDAFSDVTAGKRKEMALRLLGIRPVDGARTAARAETRARKQGAMQLADAIADTAQLEAELKEAKDIASEAKSLARAAAKDLGEGDKRARSTRKAFDRVEAARQKVEMLTIQIRSTTEERDRLASEREVREARAATLRADLATLPALEQELGTLEGIQDRYAAAERLAETVGKLAMLDERLSSMPEPDVAAAMDDLDRARGAEATAREGATRAAVELDRAHDALAAAGARVDRASEADAAEPCPTCGQPLGASFTAYLKHCKEEMAAAKKVLVGAERGARQVESTLKKAETALRAAERTGERARAGNEQREGLLQQAAERRAEVEALAAPFEGRVPDVAELAAGVRRVREIHERVAGLSVERTRLAEAEGDMRKIDARLAELAARLSACVEQAEGLAFDPAEHARMLEDRNHAEAALDAARAAERAATEALSASEKRMHELAGRLGEARETERRVDDLRTEARYLERTAMLLDGFRDHLVARVGPELSRETEALFAELTNREYEDLRIDEETLAIQIADGNTYFPVERFSGSEADLANLALRVAISTHLSHISGADLGMLVLDEVLGSLDAERKDLMVRTMGRLADRFHQLFVITHSEQVKDQFPASIEVRKVGRRRSVAELV